MQQQTQQPQSQPCEEQHKQHAHEHLTLAQAAKIAPGRPSANCVWRWCREGVKSASGDRIRLKHTRFGSRIFTTRQWLDDFGRALAQADEAHFDRMNERAARQRADEHDATRRARQSKAATKQHAAKQRQHELAMQELEEAGL